MEKKCTKTAWCTACAVTICVRHSLHLEALRPGVRKAHKVPANSPWALCRPPVMSFKWRHWGRMTGKLVCPIGPDTKLEAEATTQEVEIWGVSVAHLDSDFKINRLEVSGVIV